MFGISISRREIALKIKNHLVQELATKGSVRVDGVGDIVMRPEDGSIKFYPSDEFAEEIHRKQKAMEK